MKLSSRARKLLVRSADPAVFMQVVADSIHSPAGLDSEALTKSRADRQELLRDLANLRGDDDSWEWFITKHHFPADPPDVIISLRDALRVIWRSSSAPGVDRILNSWFTWQPSESTLELYREGWPDGFLSTWLWPFRCSVLAGRLVPDFFSLRAMLIQGVFENWTHVAYCANNECLSPYFIAKRTDQSVCDADVCKAEKQRQHALKWWNENRAGQKGKTKTKRAKARTRKVRTDGRI